MASNIYLTLTEEFNDCGVRAIICSGQAVVLHRLAVMSKDGDWIVREDAESLRHILDVLEKHGATYRYGAPLDVRWMSEGWSSHFEFRDHGIRVRTDFFTRPPRISHGELEQMWESQGTRDLPFTGIVDLAKIKMTQREKDYPVIGELARLMDSPADQLRFSRSARDVCDLCREHPELGRSLIGERPLLEDALAVDADPDRIAERLDAERRSMIKADAVRLARYEQAAEKWRSIWPDVNNEIAALPLTRAHAIVCKHAESCLPKNPAANLS